jgi:predicted RNA polymerase sigma factor
MASPLVIGFSRCGAAVWAIIVTLNRAGAVAMVDGPPVALALVDELARGGELDG